MWTDERHVGNCELRIANNELKERSGAPAIRYSPFAIRNSPVSLRPGSCFNITPAVVALRWSAIFGFVAAAALAARADDSVVYSKHDLSAFGPGPIRATEESRVCIFCHTPHNASPVAPLWNRYNPDTHYRIYRSETTDARIGQPGPESKLCLSCHDGSIALGLTLDRGPDDPIPMTHMFMPTGPSNLTSDLSDDHPIGFRYDRALTNRDPQLRPRELVDHRIQFGTRGEVECIACHDPHNNELGNFLRITDRTGALCITCHDLDGWRLSAHANSPRPVPATATAGERLPYLSMRDNACRSCHTSHSAPYREQLLYDRPSQLCLNCHDGVGGSDIHGVLNQRSGHFARPMGGGRRDVGGVLRRSKYVECIDCHNPHAVASNPARGATAFGVGGNVAVPPAMQKVSGVNLAGAPVENAAFYYEVCFKCHGDAPVLSPRRILRQRDTFGNVRRELLPTAASAHPVTFPARRTDETPSLKAEYRSRRFISCQDCHSNPDGMDRGGAQASGPHGSRFDHLLVARYETANFTMESPQAYALCYQCHDRGSILADESFAYHRVHIVQARTPCSACHAPHGVAGPSSQHSSLINFDVTIVGGQRLFQDTGRFSGSCTLVCHGVQHANFTYGP